VAEKEVSREREVTKMTNETSAVKQTLRSLVG